MNILHKVSSEEIFDYSLRGDSPPQQNGLNTSLDGMYSFEVPVTSLDLESSVALMKKSFLALAQKKKYRALKANPHLLLVHNYSLTKSIGSD